MINFLVFYITLFIFLISTYEDFKKLETYDYITFGYFFFIFMISFFSAFYFRNLDYIFYFFAYSFMGFLVSYFVYRLGILGFGDVKLLIGFFGGFYFLKDIFNQNYLNFINIFISNLNQIDFEFFFIFKNLNLIVFILNILILIFFLYFFKKNFFKKFEKKNLISFFLLILFFTLSLISFFTNQIYILCLISFSLFLILINVEENNIKFIKLKEKNLVKIIDLLININLFLILLKIIFLEKQILFALFFIIFFIIISFLIGGVFGFVYMIYLFFKKYKELNFKKITKINIFIFALLISFGMFFSLITKNIVFIILFLICSSLLFLKNFENEIFSENKKLKNIVLGDWIIQDIKKNKKIIYIKKDFNLGVLEHQLKKLKKIFDKEKTFLVKNGMAFIPPMFFLLIIISF